MIAVDTSAIVAIALDEEEADRFSRRIAAEEAVVGAPTLLEVRLVLSSRIDDPERFLDSFVNLPVVHPVAFTFQMYGAAVRAFASYGKGSGHPAQLNFGDCMAYATARVGDHPLLFKGTDFAQTDIRPALV